MSVSVKMVSVAVAVGLALALSIKVESASWVQTTGEDFLSGILSGVDAQVSPGDLVIREDLHKRIFTDKDDFDGNLNWNVSINDGGEIALNPVITYSKYSRPAIAGHSLSHAWQDPTSGDIYVAPRYDGNGFTIVHPDGTSVTYRTTGVWDTTDDPIGILIDPNLKVSHNEPFHVWKDVKSGNIYLSTNDGGLNIIHTHNTPEYGDDSVEVFSTDTQPGLLRHDPDYSWRDEEGNLYLGFPHDSGLTILYADGTSVSYTELGVWDMTHGGQESERTLISSTPRVGATSSVGIALDGKARPLFKDLDGNLYVGTDNGFTVLHHNTDAESYFETYDTSVTYRSSGVWDTTEDNVGTLISPKPKLVGDVIYHAWQDENGDIYISTDRGLSILHPDKTVTDYTTPKLAGSRVWHSWRDKQGNIYASTSHGDLFELVSGMGGLTVIHPDNTTTIYNAASDPPIAGNIVLRSWKDADGDLYIVTVSRINVIPSGRGASIKGASTSDALDVSEIAAHSIRWRGKVPVGSRISLQTRTGQAESYWRDNFDDGNPPDVSTASGRASSVTVREADGMLIFENITKTVSLVVDSGKPEGYFPKGSIVRARVRLSALGTFTYAFSFVNRGELYGERDASVNLTVPNEWRTLIYMPTQDFSMIGFSIPPASSFEVDCISVESSEGWTEWTDAENPHGSVIPNLDDNHPYLQWRVIFTAEDPRNALPALEQVAIVSGYPESATYTSPVFDTQESSVFEKIYWDAEVPDGTFLKFQIRTALTKEKLEDAPWLGPGDSEDFYTVSGTSINPIHNGDRWIQYRAIFKTKDEMKTPVLREVRIEYDMLTLVEKDKSLGPFPEVTLLDQNYPNPFNTQTIIRYQLSQTEHVKLSIYNALGQEIRSLVNRYLPAGWYTIKWDGKDGKGRNASNGIYLYVLQTDTGYREVMKMVLAK